MQTILGAGGAIGLPLAKELTTYTKHIRLVARKPVRVNATDELFTADITDAAQLDKAIEGSEIVYLAVGFEYKASVWKDKWPKLMQNTIKCCKKHKCKLVFFDNLYMYDRDSLSNMTEETPVNPSSKKGKVRAEIAQMLLDAVSKGEIQALIARASDFIATKNSILTEMVYKNLVKGKKADWIANGDKVHSFTYTGDAAKATALLGNTPDAYNQVWHLPTSEERLTGKQWVKLFADVVGAKPAIRITPIGLLGILGLFIPVLKEFKEMAYQYDRDFFLNSSKFNSRFNFTPTAPRDAIITVINEMKS